MSVSSTITATSAVPGTEAREGTIIGKASPPTVACERLSSLARTRAIRPAFVSVWDPTPFRCPFFYLGSSTNNSLIADLNGEYVAVLYCEAALLCRTALLTCGQLVSETIGCGLVIRETSIRGSTSADRVLVLYA